MAHYKQKQIWVLESRVYDWYSYEPTYVVAVVTSRSAAKRRLAALARRWVAEGGAELVDGKNGAKNAEVREGYGHLGDRRAWRAPRGIYDDCKIHADGRVCYSWE